MFTLTHFWRLNQYLYEACSSHLLWRALTEVYLKPTRARRTQSLLPSVVDLFFWTREGSEHRLLSWLVHKNSNKKDGAGHVQKSSENIAYFLWTLRTYIIQILYFQIQFKGQIYLYILWDQNSVEQNRK